MKHRYNIFHSENQLHWHTFELVGETYYEFKIVINLIEKKLFCYEYNYKIHDHILVYTSKGLITPEDTIQLLRRIIENKVFL